MGNFKTLRRYRGSNQVHPPVYRLPARLRSLSRNPVLARGTVSERPVARPERSEPACDSSLNAGRQGRIYRSKKARIRDDPAGPRSEWAFSLNWITSCLLTIRSEQPLPDASAFLVTDPVPGAEQRLFPSGALYARSTSLRPNDELCVRMKGPSTIKILLSIIGNRSAQNGDRWACYLGASVFLLAVSAWPICVIGTAFSGQAVLFGSV